MALQDPQTGLEYNWTEEAAMARIAPAIYSAGHGDGGGEGEKKGKTKKGVVNDSSRYVVHGRLGQG